VYGDADAIRIVRKPLKFVYQLMTKALSGVCVCVCACVCVSSECARESARESASESGSNKDLRTRESGRAREQELERYGHLAMQACRQTDRQTDREGQNERESERETWDERWGAGVETQKKCTGRGWGMGSSTI